MDLLGRFGVYASQSLFRPVVATGGSVVSPDPVIGGRTYRVHVFDAVGSDDFIVTDAGSEGEVEYLIVAGGGAGGFHDSNPYGGGGGGAGGALEGTTNVSAGTHAVVVGAGGVSQTPTGTQGGNSEFLVFEAIGGGYGGMGSTGDDTPGIGGSGGGGRGAGRPSGLGESGIPGQGSDGGDGEFLSGGGGGGFASAGQDATNSSGGNAGSGLLTTIQGSSKYVAVGGPGAGKTTNGLSALGGADVGGDGAQGTGNGGGGSNNNSSAGDGGSGAVIIRYPLEAAS